MTFKLATAIFAAVVFTGMGTGVAIDYWNNYAFQETVNLHKQDKKEKYQKAQAMVTSLCAETYPGNRNQEKSCFRREITVLAGSTFDQEFCQALTEEQVRADCVRFAKTESAVRENDPAICQQLTSGKAACLQEVVKERLDKTQDPRFCDILEQETRKKACVKNALLSQIKTNFDFTICTKLEEKRDQQQCRFDLTRHYIFSGGSIAFCDQLPGVEKKACLEYREEYLATESDSLQACQQLNHENSIKKCMMQFLLKNIKEGGKSIALCQTFGNLPEESQCTRHALFVIGKQLTFERCEQVRVALENNVGGETLSSLFSDINGDGRPDLLVANDFDSPDQLYLGRQKGGLVPLMARNPLIPVTPFFNMSYDTADINNDLSLDIFASDMDLMGEENTFDNLPYCERIDDAQFRKFCQESFFIQEASETVKATDCSKLETARSRSVCIASVLTEMAFRSSAESYCREIPQGYATSREHCFAMVDMKKRPSRGRVEKKGHVFQVMRNVLLVAEKGGAFQEAAAEMGVLSSSWSWNSKFADLDNDEWQDIYVGNGFQRDTRTLVSNMFFHNQQGKKFARRERDFGLEDHVITPSYTYVDYDNDGDLDVIATGMFAPVRIFTNHEAKNNLIIFELRDSKGNFYGVGSKIYVTYGDKGKRQQMRELKLGGGFQSFDPLQAHFGLGPYRVVQKVKVVWSDGSVTELEHNFQSNKKYIIKR